MNIDCNIYGSLLEICSSAGLLKVGNVSVDCEIAYTYYDYEMDDFEKAGIMPGIYEYRVYSMPGGYESIQIVIDGIENDLPNYCYIDNGVLYVPEEYARTDIYGNNKYYDIPA